MSACIWYSRHMFLSVSRSSYVRSGVEIQDHSVEIKSASLRRITLFALFVRNDEKFEIWSQKIKSSPLLRRKTV